MTREELHNQSRMKALRETGRAAGIPAGPAGRAGFEVPDRVPPLHASTGGGHRGRGAQSSD